MILRADELPSPAWVASKRYWMGSHLTRQPGGDFHRSLANFDSEAPRYVVLWPTCDGSWHYRDGFYLTVEEDGTLSPDTIVLAEVLGLDVPGQFLSGPPKDAESA